MTSTYVMSPIVKLHFHCLGAQLRRPAQLRRSIVSRIANPLFWLLAGPPCKLSKWPCADLVSRVCSPRWAGKSRTTRYAWQRHFVASHATFNLLDICRLDCYTNDVLLRVAAKPARTSPPSLISPHPSCELRKAEFRRHMRGMTAGALAEEGRRDLRLSIADCRLPKCPPNVAAHERAFRGSQRGADPKRC